MASFNRLDYTARDFDALLVELKNYLVLKYPNISFDWSNLSVESVLADIVCYLADSLHLYIDSAMSESFIDSMAEKSAILSTAALVSYQSVQRAASVATCTYTYTKKDPAAPANVLLPKGTVFKSKSGISFVAASDYILDDLYTSPSFYLTQGTLVSDTFIVTSAPYQEVTTTRTRIAANYTPEVWVNGVLWTRVDHIVQQTTGNYYERIWNGNTSFTIKFGDGTHGNIPTNSIVIYYLVTDGLAGNIAANQLFGKLTSLHPQVDITYQNTAASAGGANEESVDSARRNIPASISSAQTVVTDSDYEYLISQFAGVLFSSFEFDPVLRKIICYVLSSSYGPVPDLTLLELEKTINQKRQMGSSVFFKNVSFINAIIDVKVYLDNSLNLNADERKAVLIDKINRFFIPSPGDPVYNSVGKNVKLSDFIGMIENEAGVSYLDVSTFTRDPALTPISWSAAVGSISLDGTQYRPSVKAVDSLIRNSSRYLQSARIGDLSQEQLQTSVRIPRIFGVNTGVQTSQEYRAVSQFGGRLTGGWTLQPTSVVAEKVCILMGNANGKYSWSSWYNTGIPGTIPAYFAERYIGRNADSKTGHFTVSHWLDGIEYPDTCVGYLDDIFELDSGSFAFKLTAGTKVAALEDLFQDDLTVSGYTGMYRCKALHKHMKTGTLVGTISISGTSIPATTVITDDGAGGILWNSSQIGYVDYDQGEILIDKARLGTGVSLTSLTLTAYRYFDFPNIYGETAIIYLSPFLGNIQVNKNEFCTLGDLTIQVGYE